MAEGTKEGNGHGVGQVTAEGHPALTHGHQQVGEVIQRGVLGQNRGREAEQFIQRLQGGTNGEDQREGHHQAHQRQHDVDADVTAHRAVGVTALDDVLLDLLHLFAAELSQTAKFIGAAVVLQRLVEPEFVHVVVDFLAFDQKEAVLAFVLHLGSHSAGQAAMTDIAELLELGVGDGENGFVLLVVEDGFRFVGYHAALNLFLVQG